ncbi:MAG TPA: NAD-dependent epimerase/dehydratase family protein [Puia sp.]|jgi:nucleoside-diphosphate-sugar epimerase|nr:NAD-dependent epimerase/dehydratase family protein [Puia sp.]
MKKESILVIGACGQIGSELLPGLRRAYGSFRVIAADRLPLDNGPDHNYLGPGPYEQLDVLDRRALGALIDRYDINQVYHLAAMLSATGEQNPQQAWDLNMQGLLNVLDLAREKKLARVFWPSSIAVFGPHPPKHGCPQDAPHYPATVYGISKTAGEHWCRYYYEKYGVDTRSLRYPGLISWRTPPGGGTTDYAVDIFHHAAAGKPYTCFLQPDTRLPMMYMPDAIRATLELMQAPLSSLSVRGAYNLAAMSFTPAELTAAIRRHVPAFQIDYAPDYRQTIADSWPGRIDDHMARQDWKWSHEYELAAMTRDMILHLAIGRETAQQPTLQQDSIQ